VRVFVVGAAVVSVIAPDDYGRAFHEIDNDVSAVSRLPHVSPKNWVRYEKCRSERCARPSGVNGSVHSVERTESSVDGIE
jgi:hypothetical protein